MAHKEAQEYIELFPSLPKPIQDKQRISSKERGKSSRRLGIKSESDGNPTVFKRGRVPGGLQEIGAAEDGFA